VAFYLARGLRTNGLELPQRLIVSACRPPHLPPNTRADTPTPLEQFVERLQQRYEAIPEEVLSNPEVLALFASILRADFTILGNRCFIDQSHRLACAISAYAGRDDEHVPNTVLRDGSNHTSRDRPKPPYSPGGHFYLRSLSGD